MFDTHAHLNDEQFQGRLEGVLARAREVGITDIVCVAVDAAGSRDVIGLAETHLELHAAVGIHPNHASQAAAEDWDRVVELANHPRVVALGESGLDKHWNDSPFELQQDYFARHMHLSRVTGLPFIVHMRECGAETLEMLSEARRQGPLRGVMHSFTGDADLAAACVELGLHVSFSGIVTYKKSDDLRRVAAAVPAERLLIETDSPYLSPHPCRSHRPNEPALIQHTARCLADVRGIALDRLEQVTSDNARGLFARSRRQAR